MEFFKSLKFNFFIQIAEKTCFSYTISHSLYQFFGEWISIPRAAFPFRDRLFFILNFIFIKLYYVLILHKNIQNLFFHTQRNFTPNLFSIRSFPGDRIVWVLLLFDV